MPAVSGPFRCRRSRVPGVHRSCAREVRARLRTRRRRRSSAGNSIGLGSMTAHPPPRRDITSGCYALTATIVGTAPVARSMPPTQVPSKE